MAEILKYGATAKWLHWLVTFIVIVMLIFGPGLEDLPLDEREQVIMVHSGLGTLVLILMLIRWPWRLTHDVPGPAATMGALQTRLSKIMHWSFYVLLVLQPILGILQACTLPNMRLLRSGRSPTRRWLSITNRWQKSFTLRMVLTANY
jgi:cytochrome b561